MSPVEVAQADGVISHLGVVRCLLQLTGGLVQINGVIDRFRLGNRFPPSGVQSSPWGPVSSATRLAAGHAKLPAADDSSTPAACMVPSGPGALALIPAGRGQLVPARERTSTSGGPGR